MKNISNLLNLLTGNAHDISRIIHSNKYNLLTSICFILTLAEGYIIKDHGFNFGRGIRLFSLGLACFLGIKIRNEISNRLLKIHENIANYKLNYDTEEGGGESGANM